MEAALRISRDISVIMLVIEYLILGAIPLLVLLKITQGMRRLLPLVRPALRRFHQQLCLVLGAIERGVLAMRKPFVWGATVRQRIARFAGRS